MKYGRLLTTQANPAWSEYYISYKALRTLIKRMVFAFHAGSLQDKLVQFIPNQAPVQYASGVLIPPRIPDDDSDEASGDDEIDYQLEKMTTDSNSFDKKRKKERKIRKKKEKEKENEGKNSKKQKKNKNSSKLSKITDNEPEDVTISIFPPTTLKLKEKEKKKDKDKDKEKETKEKKKNKSKKKSEKNKSKNSDFLQNSTNVLGMSLLAPPQNTETTEHSDAETDEDDDVHDTRSESESSNSDSDNDSDNDGNGLEDPVSPISALGLGPMIPSSSSASASASKKASLASDKNKSKEATTPMSPAPFPTVIGPMDDDEEGMISAVGKQSKKSSESLSSGLSHSSSTPSLVTMRSTQNVHEQSPIILSTLTPKGKTKEKGKGKGKGTSELDFAFDETDGLDKFERFENIDNTELEPFLTKTSPTSQTSLTSTTTALSPTKDDVNIETKTITKTKTPPKSSTETAIENYETFHREYWILLLSDFAKISGFYSRQMAEISVELARIQVLLRPGGFDARRGLSDLSEVDTSHIENTSGYDDDSDFDLPKKGSSNVDEIGSFGGESREGFHVNRNGLNTFHRRTNRNQRNSRSKMKEKMKGVASVPISASVPAVPSVSAPGNGKDYEDVDNDYETNSSSDSDNDSDNDTDKDLSNRTVISSDSQDSRNGRKKRTKLRARRLSGYAMSLGLPSLVEAEIPNRSGSGSGSGFGSGSISASTTRIGIGTGTGTGTGAGTGPSAIEIASPSTVSTDVSIPSSNSNVSNVSNVSSHMNLNIPNHLSNGSKLKLTPFGAVKKSFLSILPFKSKPIDQNSENRENRENRDNRETYATFQNQGNGRNVGESTVERYSPNEYEYETYEPYEPYEPYETYEGYDHYEADEKRPFLSTFENTLENPTTIRSAAITPESQTYGALLSLYERIYELKLWCGLNVLGFRKIMKKYEKYSPRLQTVTGTKISIVHTISQDFFHKLPKANFYAQKELKAVTEKIFMMVSREKLLAVETQVNTARSSRGMHGSGSGFGSSAGHESSFKIIPVIVSWAVFLFVLALPLDFHSIVESMEAERSMKAGFPVLITTNTNISTNSDEGLEDNSTSDSTNKTTLIFVSDNESMDGIGNGNGASWIRNRRENLSNTSKMATFSSTSTCPIYSSTTLNISEGRKFTPFKSREPFKKLTFWDEKPNSISTFDDEPEIISCAPYGDVSISSPGESHTDTTATTTNDSNDSSSSSSSGSSSSRDKEDHPFYSKFRKISTPRPSSSPILAEDSSHSILKQKGKGKHKENEHEQEQKQEQERENEKIDRKMRRKEAKLNPNLSSESLTGTEKGSENSTNTLVATTTPVTPVSPVTPVTPNQDFTPLSSKERKTISKQAHKCLALLLWASVSWVTEAVPYYCTALMIPPLVVILGLAVDDNGVVLAAKPASQYVASHMVNYSSFLILLGFAISACFCKAQLELRIARTLQQRYGDSPKAFILAVMMLGLFLSAWLNNKTGPILCVSFLTPIMSDIGPKSRFNKCLLLGLAFACNIGGMATPIASLQNILAVANLETVGISISFGLWMLFSVPFCIVLTLLSWLFVIKLVPPDDVESVPELLFEEKPLGKLHFMVLGSTLFAVLSLAFMHKVENMIGGVAVLSMLFMFFVFSTGILTIMDLNSFNWHLILLIGGGAVLGGAIKSSKLLDILASGILSTLGGGPVMVYFQLVFVVIVLTSCISHTVGALILMPLLVQMGLGLGMPATLTISCGLAISGAMALPFSSFPNLNTILVRNDNGDTYIKAMDIMKGGIPLTLLSYIFIIASYPLIQWIFPNVPNVPNVPGFSM